MSENKRPPENPPEKDEDDKLKFQQYMRICRRSSKFEQLSKNWKKLRISPSKLNLELSHIVSVYHLVSGYPTLGSSIYCPGPDRTRLTRGLVRKLNVAFHYIMRRGHPLTCKLLTLKSRRAAVLIGTLFLDLR
jgi:hypothetical protein